MVRVLRTVLWRSFIGARRCQTAGTPIAATAAGAYTLGTTNGDSLRERRAAVGVIVMMSMSATPFRRSARKHKARCRLVCLQANEGYESPATLFTDTTKVPASSPTRRGSCTSVAEGRRSDTSTDDSGYPSRWPKR